MNHYVGPGNGTQGLQLLGPLQAECRFLLQIIFLLYLLIVCTNMCPDVPMEVRGQPEEVTSFLPPYELQGSNLGLQAWWWHLYPLSRLSCPCAQALLLMQLSVFRSEYPECY